MNLRLLSAFCLSLSIMCFNFQFSACADAAYNKSTPNTSEPNLRGISEEDKHSFSVLACITWWSHDAVGYHPAMTLFLENITGCPITGAESSSTSSTSLNARLGGEIPFQGRFTDLRTGDVTVAREYKRAPIRNHERFAVVLRGPRSYELPIDSSLWPAIECKAMCRLSDAGAEDLYIGHLTQVTMTDEEAQAQLVSLAGRSPLLKHGVNTEAPNMLEESGAEEPALHGLNNTANGGKPHKPSDRQSKSKIVKTKPADTNLPKDSPSVGDDFYVFDKLYGGAAEFQSPNGRDDLTWTHYKSHGLIADVYAGSRNANKVDVIITVLTPNVSLKERDILTLGKMLARSKKSDTVTPFSHSVRYLSSGRSEFMTTAIRDCRIISFKIPEDKGYCIVIAVSRLPGDVETALSNYGKRVNFLKFIDLKVNTSD